LPRERVKNNRRHEVPLARQALAILRQVPRIGEVYVFTLNGRRPIAASKLKGDLTSSPVSRAGPFMT
jgi:hypothetical protein